MLAKKQDRMTVEENEGVYQGGLAVISPAPDHWQIRHMVTMVTYHGYHGYYGYHMVTWAHAFVMATVAPRVLSYLYLHL